MRDNASVVPDWLPPLLAATLVILLLNLALLEQRRRRLDGRWGRIRCDLAAMPGS